MDITSLIQSFGYVGLFAVIFAESGLLIGFFLPGDSLLFTAGLLAAQGTLNLYLVIIIMFVAAVVGVNTGYAIGKNYGPKLFSRSDSLIFNQKHLKRSQSFYEIHGGKTIILARFTPIVRSIAPILAGVGQMRYRSFLIFNVVGAALWVVGITLIGYYFGNLIPNVDHYIVPFIVVLMMLSFAPPLVHVWRDTEQRQLLLAKIRRLRQRKPQKTNASSK